MFKDIKKRGYTDKLYYLNFRITWIFVAVCVLLTIFSGVLNITDLSLVSVGIPAAFTELSIHTGFIIWKAKAENIRKYGDVNVPEEGEI